MKKFMNKRNEHTPVTVYENGLCGLSVNKGYVDFDKDSESNLKVCVLSRIHYTESQRVYPIKNVWHLFKAIKAEVSIHPTGCVLWAITRFEIGNFEVTFWQVSRDIISALSEDFRLLIPETYLMSQELTKKGLYQIGAKRPLFFSNQGNQCKSALKDELLPTIERFKLASAVSLDTSVIEIDDQEYAGLLRNGVSKRKHWLQLGLWVKKAKTVHVNWSKWLWPATAAFGLLAVYFLALNLFVSHRLEVTSTELKEQRKEMSAFITQETKLRSARKQVSSYKALIDNNPGLSTLSGILVPLNQSDSNLNIRNIELNGNEAILRLTSSSATKTLNLLASNPIVGSIDFTSTIVKSADQLDMFEVTLTLVNGGANGQK